MAAIDRTAGQRKHIPLSGVIAMMLQLPICLYAYMTAL